MKKKIILIAFAFIIFLMPVQNGIFPHEANAIWGKIANMSTKKVAKEVIKEIAEEAALNFAVNEAQKIADAATWNLNVQDEFTAICLEALEPSGECKKPVQVKKTLTSTDKQNIGTQAELELEKALNNGVKMAKWQKFLDFFLPIFSVSLILTGITYAIDPDVKSLFDEIALDTLVALGLMKPIDPITPPPAGYVDATTGEPIPEKTLNPTGTPSLLYKNEKIGATTDATISLNPTSFKTENAVLFADIAYQSTAVLQRTELTSRTTPTGNGSVTYGIWPNGGGTTYFQFHGASPVTNAYKNGVLIDSENSALIRPPIFQIPKITSIKVQYPHLTSDGKYTSIVDISSQFTTVNYQIVSKTSTPPPVTMGYIHSNVTGQSGNGISQQLTIYENATLKEWTPYYPKFDDVVEPLPETEYEREGQITLIPPIAIPYTHADTNETLMPRFNETTQTTDIVDKDGNIVEEDKVKVGDPIVTKDPQGNPQVEPPATADNPNPSPIPLTPPPPASNVPPVETAPPIYPEGESCDVGLKLPRFNPLLHTISDAFPFSIPFDLKDGFDAIFAEMGNEKPEFDYKFNFMGDEQSWKITIPDYFDSWKAFTDSFLIFIFDVGIIYAIYRFMGGGN